jgi:hypothetical protein
MHESLLLVDGCAPIKSLQALPLPILPAHLLLSDVGKHSIPTLYRRSISAKGRATTSLLNCRRTSSVKH